MKVVHSVSEMQQVVTELIGKKKRIGFVPTMGFFHDGHLHLMKEAKKENDIVITSIFVNPLQFGPNEDYEKYPRDVEHDAKLAKEIGVDILFVPNVAKMYPREMQIKMHISERVDVLCGRSRPGHFDGVLTVLTKLFHIVKPHSVYFGLKDAQQVAVVDALINDLNFPIKLVGIPTVREEDGLAKSSRNVYLTDEERKEAVWLFKGLQKGQQLITDGEKNPLIVVNHVMDEIVSHTSGELDYVELLSYPDLKELPEINQPIILAVAVHFKNARLIDNIIMDQLGFDRV